LSIKVAVVFLGQAYVSFDRSEKNRIDLRSANKLDQENFKLFRTFFRDVAKERW